VDSTTPGFGKEPIVDGRISPRVLAGRAWKSEDCAVSPHFVEVSLPERTVVDEIALWVPFVGSSRERRAEDEDEDESLSEDDLNGGGGIPLCLPPSRFTGSSRFS
jgi:hypothetical protein